MYPQFFIEKCAETILAEGGDKYTDDPDDPGGGTKYGIASASHPGVDVKNLTYEGAQSIYYKEYWLPLLLDQVNSKAVAGEIFDTAVNMGVVEAAEIAQRSVNFLGEALAVDGHVGMKTIGAINAWASKDAEALFKVLNGFQFMHYVEIIQNRPKSKKYARGWMQRIQEYSREK